MLHGKKVYLRRLEAEDLPRTLKWVNDPEMFITMGLWGPRTSNEQKDWYENVSRSKTNLVFALCLTDSHEHIGNLSLFDIDMRNRNAGLTIIIPDQENQGKGYGPESVSLLCDYAFRFLNLEKVYCKTDNPNASKMYERIGFVHEGTLRKQAFRYGEYIDKLCYGLLRGEFINE